MGCRSGNKGRGADAALALAGIRFSPDGRWNGRSETNGQFTIRQIASGEFLGTLPVRDAAFSADGKMLAAVSGTNQFTVWTLPSLQPATNILSDGTFAGPVLFSPDGSWLSAGSRFWISRIPQDKRLAPGSSLGFGLSPGQPITSRREVPGRTELYVRWPVPRGGVRRWLRANL